ncbi:MAG: hypothetical protein AABX24_06145 [Nanoarchaeota archaeon]
MNIGVDIDEVLAELMDSYFQYHNQKYNTNVQKKDMFSYSFSDVFGGTEEENRLKVLDFFKSEQFHNLKLVNGALDTIKQLAQEHRLCVITARPHVIRQETEQWLQRHFPNCFQSINLTNQWHGVGEKQLKSSIGKKQKIDLMIDDSLSHAMDCASQGIYVLLVDFGYPWNRVSKELPEKIKRVHSLEEIIDEIARH